MENALYLCLGLRPFGSVQPTYRMMSSKYSEITFLQEIRSGLHLILPQPKVTVFIFLIGSPRRIECHYADTNAAVSEHAARCVEMCLEVERLTWISLDERRPFILALQVPAPLE